MDQIRSSPLLENGGFFVGLNNKPRRSDPSIPLSQSLSAALALTLFISVGLLFLAGH
jgi:hypothetical protein